MLMHQAGRDATQAFHASHSAWVRTMLPAFCKGRMEDRKTQRLQQVRRALFGALPAISRDNPHIATKYMSWASVQEEQVFKELTREVTAAGLMKPRIAPYANLAAILTALFCNCCILCCARQSSGCCVNNSTLLAAGAAS